MLIDFLLRQECTVEPWLREAEGREILGEAQTRRCRLQEGAHLKQAPGIPGTADAVPARALMYCTGEMIPVRSRVTCAGKTYVVADCCRMEFWGQEHLEVTLL